MKIKDLVKKPPCAKCPYTLGLVKTLHDPCPECERNGYQMYKFFQKGGYIGGSTNPEG